MPHQLTDFFAGFAQLLWPLIVVVVVWRLLPELKAILRRVGEAKNLNIKWGDKELSFQEAADNIQRVVGSLIDSESSKAASAGGELEGLRFTKVAAGLGHGPARPSTPFSILWVDDRPKNNALEMATLKRRGLEIAEAQSTREALGLFEPGRFGVVITDMARRENGDPNPQAGIELLKAVRKIEPAIPVIGYCSGFSVKAYAQRFREAGGGKITSSAVELFKELDRIFGIGGV